MPDTGTYSTFLEHLLQTLKTVGATSIFKILLAVVILIIGSKLIKIIIKLLNKSHSYAKLDESVRSFLNSFIRVVLYAVLYITAATALGVPETSLVTALASCGLAVGLALQGSLSNFAGGLMILIFKPFVIGDYIVSGTFEGTVKEINVLYTVIVTLDNRTVTIDALLIARAQRQDNCGSVLAHFNAESDGQAKKIHRTERHILNPHAVQMQEGRYLGLLYVISIPV